MDNKRTRVVLSFDDGRGDNYRIAVEELLPRNLKATFNITTGYINGNISEKDAPCENPPLTVGDVQELGKYEEFEIAGHGHKHLNTLEDWKKGIDVLTDWLGNKWKKDDCIGIASPHSGMSTEAVRMLQNELDDMKIKYVRIGLSNQKELLQRIINKLAGKLKSKQLFYWANKKSIRTIGNDLVVYSIPVLHTHTIEQIIYTIEKAISKKQDVVLMFHSILKKGEEFYDSMWTWDYEKFVQLCDYLVKLRSQQKIEISTTMDTFM